DQFPAEYQGALFVQDWTLGRILCVPLQRQGAGWVSEPREFAVGQNQFGFAPTDMEVGPDGSLYVSVGGRGTRGSVYRISCRVTDGGQKSAADAAASGVDRVLAARQPNTAWSRAEWVGLATQQSADAFRAAAADGARS
ncbi:MAG: hypothetical protein ACKON9_08020, partial [Planctomycetaceae bacterium]